MTIIHFDLLDTQIELLHDLSYDDIDRLKDEVSQIDNELRDAGVVTQSRESAIKGVVADIQRSMNSAARRNQDAETAIAAIEGITDDIIDSVTNGDLAARVDSLIASGGKSPPTGKGGRNPKGNKNHKTHQKHEGKKVETFSFKGMLEAFEKAEKYDDLHRKWKRADNELNTMHKWKKALIAIGVAAGWLVPETEIDPNTNIKKFTWIRLVWEKLPLTVQRYGKEDVIKDGKLKFGDFAKAYATQQRKEAEKAKAAKEADAPPQKKGWFVGKPVPIATGAPGEDNEDKE